MLYCIYTNNLQCKNVIYIGENRMQRTYRYWTVHFLIINYFHGLSPY